jgi:hypothetical protein
LYLASAILIQMYMHDALFIALKVCPMYKKSVGKRLSLDALNLARKRSIESPRVKTITYPYSVSTI